MKRIFSLLFVLLLTAAGCPAPGKQDLDYIFLITLDTTRADTIDYALSGNELTPHLAQLASRGQYFDNAYALIPITLPSHASMFYSLPPHRLRLYNNGQVQKIAEPTVAQLLKGKGYTTGAVISLGVLKKDFGLDRGFDRYFENFKPYLWSKRAEDVNKDAFRLIRQSLQDTRRITDRKYFSWIHYSDPHEPYFPPHDDEEGKFSVSVNNKEVFVSRSTEEPVVNVEIPLNPGKNRLRFETRIPPVFKNFPACTVDYIKYRDFSLEAPEVETVIPGNWERKKTRTGIDYYTEENKSEVVLLNRGREATAVKLRFIYSLRVGDAVRKAFYKEEIKYMDAQLGKFIEFLKENNIYDNAVFIIMGDHGEGLGEYRGHYGHIHYLNQPAVRVPLIIAGKGIEPKGKREETVSALDIAPTILDIAGITKPAFMLGRSLLKPLTRTKLLLETYSPEAYFDAFSVLDYPYQVIFYPGRRKEKLEFVYLKEDGTGTRENLGIRVKLVKDVLKISRIITATKGKIGGASARHKEILKSLGYL